MKKIKSKITLILLFATRIFASDMDESTINTASTATSYKSISTNISYPNLSELIENEEKVRELNEKTYSTVYTVNQLTTNNKNVPWIVFGKDVGEEKPTLSLFMKTMKQSLRIPGLSNNVGIRTVSRNRFNALESYMQEICNKWELTIHEIKLMSSKLASTQESLSLAQQENVQLREEIDNLRQQLENSKSDFSSRKEKTSSNFYSHINMIRGGDYDDNISLVSGLSANSERDVASRRRLFERSFKLINGGEDFISYILNPKYEFSEYTSNLYAIFATYKDDTLKKQNIKFEKRKVKISRKYAPTGLYKYTKQKTVAQIFKSDIDEYSLVIEKFGTYTGQKLSLFASMFQYDDFTAIFDSTDGAKQICCFMQEIEHFISDECKTSCLETVGSVINYIIQQDPSVADNRGTKSNNKAFVSSFNFTQQSFCKVRDKSAENENTEEEFDVPFFDTVNNQDGFGIQIKGDGEEGEVITIGIIKSSVLEELYPRDFYNWDYTIHEAAELDDSFGSDA